MRFPGGSVAAGLLMLRAAIGLIAILQGWAYLKFGSQTTLRASVGSLLILCGVVLVIGLFTDVAAVGIAFAAICTQLSWLPSPAPNFFETASPAILVEVVAIALVLIGPGAWSVDSRRFGFREIAIPRRPVDPNP